MLSFYITAAVRTQAFTARHPRLRVRIKTSGELVVEDNPAVLYTGPPATPFITPAV